MKYIDLHCDSATVSFDAGYSLTDAPLHVNFNKLGASGCAAQCLAIFTDGETESRFEDYRRFFSSGVNAVESYGGLKSCVQSGKTAAMLTVENLGFTGGDLQKIAALGTGVVMASLVWNNENALAYPNLIMRGGLPDFSATEGRGLKPAGRAAVELLDELKIIVDVSHLSDGGTDELLKDRKIPTVASHSNARAVCDMPRNLTDAQIKAIADCGGVVGVNFCKDFLGAGDTFDCVKRHVAHILKIGGEDALAFGSDFDGIPTVNGLEGCEKMPALIAYLADAFGVRITEKLCFENFARVLREVRP